jgi:hypothetical protein
MGEVRNVYKIVAGKQGRVLLDNPDIDGRIIIKISIKDMEFLEELYDY